jgi:phosphoribosylanthranilate isomerase
MDAQPQKILLKVCGITRQEDATACEAVGVDFCGFVFHPASPRYITPERVAAIQTTHCKRVGVFTTHTVYEILETLVLARLDYAQLHGRQSDAVVHALGGHRVIRVVFPGEGVFPASHAEPSVAYTLFDSGYGTGKAFDWKLLEGAKRPFFVAGGLNAQNLPDLLKVCRPDGVDLNSGVEVAPGIKSAERIQEIKELL